MNFLTTIFSIAALLQLGSCNPQYGDNSASSSTAAAAASMTSSSSSKVQTVSVGSGGLIFSPNTITASQGDVIEFVISSSHSVAQSSFDSPCQPSGDNAIFSGFPADGTVFSVTVNDTNPVWIYCSTPGHCEAGMAMVINAPSSGNTLAAYMSAARSVSSSSSPSHVGGGVFGKVSQSSGSSSSGTATGTATSSASPKSSSSSATAAAMAPASGNFVVGFMLVAGVLTAGMALLWS